MTEPNEPNEPTGLTPGVQLTEAQVAELHARYEREAVARTDDARESFGEWLERTGQEHVRLPPRYSLCMDCGQLVDLRYPKLAAHCDKHLAEERMARAQEAPTVVDLSELEIKMIVRSKVDVRNGRPIPPDQARVLLEVIDRYRGMPPGMFGGRKP